MGGHPQKIKWKMASGRLLFLALEDRGNNLVMWMTDRRLRRKVERLMAGGGVEYQRVGIQGEEVWQE